MDSTHKDKQFYEMADAYIALANKQSGKTDQGTVSATFLYAAARFNTFLVAQASDSAEQFSSRKEEIMEYFMAEYKKMLEEHFEDYSKNFAMYLGNKKKD